VASVQTMQREARLKRFKTDEFGLIIIDEAHRAAGTISYKTIMDYFPAAKLLLLTATPMRADKKSMGLITNHVAVHHDMAWGVKEGYILEPEVHSIFIQSIDISQVTVTAGELNKAEQDAVFSVEETQLGIARATLDNIGDRTTILFSGPSVATAEKLTEILNRPAFKPGCARLVHADTPEDERREIKAKHEAGEFQILVNVGIYTEGYDSPKVSAIVLARMTKSRTLLEQMACRGDRLLPGIGSLPTREQRLAAIAASAKPKFLLIDFHGNMGRHNLATMVDVFAGEYTEAIKARAKELLKEEALTPTQALEKAQEEHDKKEAKKAQRAALRRSQMSATVRWTSKVFNPFALLGIPEMGVLPKGEVKLASLSVRAALAEAGFEPPVEGWTHEVASVVVEEIKRRKSLGLCSARMVATLKRMGVDATSMPMEKAGYLIGALKRNREQHKFWGWLPGQKDRIMRGARE
jgi:superfamily II DNA or RNA helicase